MTENETSTTTSNREQMDGDAAPPLRLPSAADSSSSADSKKTKKEHSRLHLWETATGWWRKGHKLEHAGLLGSVMDAAEKTKRGGNHHHHHDNDDGDSSIHGIPVRQFFIPRVPYPFWDNHWFSTTQNNNKDCPRLFDPVAEKKRKVTRHILLIRHGQYDETHKKDDDRHLTELGKRQAHATGQRIQGMVTHNNERSAQQCRVSVMCQSDMTRAKETCRIISTYTPEVQVQPPDPLLNEGHPCHSIPGKVDEDDIRSVDKSHSRLEGAFQKYFGHSSWLKWEERAAGVSASMMIPPREECVSNTTATTLAQKESSNEAPPPQQQHQFEILVCHSNVIRYFTCRALQIPPEAWARMSLFNGSITYLVISGRHGHHVHCRLLGDIGHMEYRDCSLDMQRGFNWDY